MEIAQLTRLTILDLSITPYYNPYYTPPYYLYSGGSGLKLENPNLVKLVRNLSEVRELYLDGINIALKGNEWGHALSSFLPHLRVLSMSRCNLSGPIDSSLETLQNLSIIRLRYNLLSASVPDFFAKFSNLTLLDLHSCNLSGWFPNNIFQMTYLRLASCNHIEGPILEEIIMNFRALSYLNLSNNNLAGHVPLSIGKLQHLESLDLSNNNLGGHIPSTIGKLEQLEWLDLSKNSLTGEIPPELANLPSLSFANLSYNHLLGRIPVGAHLKLQSFDASSFQGNDGLYGPPLTQGPNNGTQRLMPPPTSANKRGVDFEFITGLVFGVVFGLGIIIWPLFFWKQWRIRYWKCVAFILCSIFPQIYIDYQRHEGQWFTVLRWSR